MTEQNELLERADARLAALKVEGREHIESWRHDGADHENGPEHDCPACDNIFGEASLVHDLRNALEAALGVSGGVSLIAAERSRQISAEGWTPAHDDTHSDGALAAAACCYAALGRRQVDGTVLVSVEEMPPPAVWPFDAEWWKPSSDPTRNLVKAGALIAAEIDRLQRREQPCSGVRGDPAVGIGQEGPTREKGF